MGEQLVAARMNAGQRRDRRALVEMMDEGPGKRAGEMDVAAGDQLRNRERCPLLHVLDVGEPFRAQQILGDQGR